MHLDRSSCRELPEIELDQFDLSTRTRNCLINQRIQNVGQVSELTTADIRAWPNAGRKTLRELQELLGSVGLTLKDDPGRLGHSSRAS
jgi:DNA-directed RNA polymerase subunit alpha